MHAFTNLISNKRIRAIIEICALLLCMVVAFTVCGSKQGFHEDEYYSYYSSNRTDGFWVENDKLIDRQTILNEFTVVDGQGDNYSLVKEVQSWDVHPPIYYFILHFVCSRMPGVFNMWQGLGINLFCLGVSLVLMRWLMQIILPDRPYIALLTCMLWGMSGATLSGVVFIRMYMLLTVWVLAVTILHAKEYIRIRDNGTGDNPIHISFYIELAILTFLGFMTHYYFFIWLFFLAVAFNFMNLIRTRKVRDIFIYGVTMVVAFGLCYVFYPAWPAQMFHGQRGAQATGNFVDVSNTLERLAFFGGIVNRIGFGGLLWIALLALVVIICVKRGAGVSETSLMLLCAGLGYFVIVSKTALMLGDSSIRYQMPILGVVYVALVTALVTSLGMSLGEQIKRIPMWLGITIGILLIVFNCVYAIKGNVSFLYPEEEMHREMLSAYPDAQVVYAYDSDPTATWCVWDSTDELLQSRDVFFMAGDQIYEITDERMDVIGSHDQIILYVDNAVDPYDVIHIITAINPQISTMEKLYDHKFCGVYICQ